VLSVLYGKGSQADQSSPLIFLSPCRSSFAFQPAKFDGGNLMMTVAVELQGEKDEYHKLRDRLPEAETECSGV
jgi:hypothetical protein